MLEPQNGGEKEHSSDTLVGLLRILAELQEKQVAATLEQNNLAKQRTDTTSNLALYASN